MQFSLTNRTVCTKIQGRRPMYGKLLEPEFHGPKISFSSFLFSSFSDKLATSDALHHCRRQPLLPSALGIGVHTWYWCTHVVLVYTRGIGVHTCANASPWQGTPIYRCGETRLHENHLSVLVLVLVRSRSRSGETGPLTVSHGGLYLAHKLFSIYISPVSHISSNYGLGKHFLADDSQLYCALSQFGSGCFLSLWGSLTASIPLSRGCAWISSSSMTEKRRLLWSGQPCT